MKTTSNPSSEMSFYLATNGDDLNENGDEKIKDIPFRLAFGITLALCDGFLLFTKIPILTNVGKSLTTGGIAMCTEAIICKEEEKKKKRKNQN